MKTVTLKKSKKKSSYTLQFEYYSHKKGDVHDPLSLILLFLYQYLYSLNLLSQPFQ